MRPLIMGEMMGTGKRDLQKNEKGLRGGRGGYIYRVGYLCEIRRPVRFKGGQLHFDTRSLTTERESKGQREGTMGRCGKYRCRYRYSNMG